MSEEDYRNHMVNVSAPMTKGLMVKYGIKRWTQVNNNYVVAKMDCTLIQEMQRFTTKAPPAP